MQTNDTNIKELMEKIKSGKIQLPDFQRDWVWDDNRIRALIASITNNFPVGAAMFLDYGNKEVRFKYRPVEGAPETDDEPEKLILDGQQRLTSIYSAMCNEKPVKTKTDTGKEIFRFYYIDIKKAVTADVDRIDAIISVPENKKITSDFGRNILLDLSSREKEFENKMFPLNIMFDGSANDWSWDYFDAYNGDPEIRNEYKKFKEEILERVTGYKIPVITLEKDTPKEAVCQVFENVNTGGVSLTVFELLTAIFAMDNTCNLREEWKQLCEKIFDEGILKSITATDFITACTLLKSYALKQTVSCKKKDVLNLKLSEYRQFKEILTAGFIEAKNFLFEEKIFVSRDLPYTTQLIPLAVICALLKEKNLLGNAAVREKIRAWYWCGVFGELYGSATETRYVNDVVDVMKQICDNGATPKTVNDMNFNPMRLLTLQTRNSAAYKGAMALVMKNHARDFISGQEMDSVLFSSANIDIHHIFPKSYCEKKKYPSLKWNSVVNKTPLTYRTNRMIGGDAPSIYLKKIESENKITFEDLKKYLLSHKIDIDDCVTDSFDNFFVHRAKYLLDAIEEVTGKPIQGRNGEEVIQKFGAGLK